MRRTVPWLIGFASNRPTAALIGDVEVSLPTFLPNIAVAVLEGTAEDLEPARIADGKLYGWADDNGGDLLVASIIVLRVETDSELVQAAGADLKQLLDRHGYCTKQWLVESPCSSHSFVFTKVWYKEQSK